MPDCAAEPGPSLLVLLPSPSRSPPLDACEPRVPVEPLHRSARPTLGGIPGPSLPSFLSLLCFSSCFLLPSSTLFSLLYLRVQVSVTTETTPACPPKAHTPAPPSP